jgi:putative transposase
VTRQSLSFAVDAVVVLPDHLHVVMTLPPGNANFSSRLSLIKRRFTTGVAKAGVPIPRHSNGEHALWQRRFWEHTIRDDKDFERHVDYIHFNPLSMALSHECATGRIPHFTATCAVGCCLRTGQET